MPPTSYGSAPTAESIDGIDVQAIVVEPSRDAPDSVRRIAQEGKLCVMFYGPAANKVTLAFLHLLTQKDSARALCTPLCHAMKARYPIDGLGLVSGSCRAWCSLKTAGIGKKRLCSGQQQPIFFAGHRTARPWSILCITVVWRLFVPCLAVAGAFRPYSAGQ